MTQAISSANASGFASELAMLLLENESNQAESARQSRDAAREDVLSNAHHQIDALHSAANASMDGALVGAALTVTGGLCDIAAASSQYDVDVGKAKGDCGTLIASSQYDATVFSKVASASSSLAGIANGFGKSVDEHFQADAKHYEIMAEQAKWRASDASTSLDKADKQGDKVLDALQGIQRDQNASNNAIIGRI